MRIHIPVCLVVYQAVDVDDDLDIKIIDDDLLDDKMKGLKIPHGHGIPVEVWTEHLAAMVAESDAVSALLGKLADMREDNPGIKAEMTPCFGSIPFVGLN